VLDVQRSPDKEADLSSTVGQRVVNAVGGGSPEVPPEQFAALLGQIRGAKARRDVMRQLQRRYGNYYVGQVIQAKLAVDAPGDRYEEEADRVADAVMRMPEPRVLPSTAVSDKIQRLCTECREGEEERIHPKEAPGQTRTVTPGLEARLNVTSGSGQPLPRSVRGFMEPRFGTDFGRVRVHAGSEAAGLNRELQAQAFTRQRDIYWTLDKENPGLRNIYAN
jgi:hypothetical protein